MIETQQSEMSSKGLSRPSKLIYQMIKKDSFSNKKKSKIYQEVLPSNYSKQLLALIPHMVLTFSSKTCLNLRSIPISTKS
jgi:hypothetical protein